MAHFEAVVTHQGELVAHWGAEVAHMRAVEALLVATPDCKSAFLGTKLAISSAYK